MQVQAYYQRMLCKPGASYRASSIRACVSLLARVEDVFKQVIPIWIAGCIDTGAKPSQLNKVTRQKAPDSLVLGGSWVVISGAISPLIWVISIVTLLITTHEPPSSNNPKIPCLSEPCEGRAWYRSLHNYLYSSFGFPIIRTLQYTPKP